VLWLLHHSRFALTCRWFVDQLCHPNSHIMIPCNAHSYACYALQIPLAKKLETCGGFGVSSSEYLGYAEKNVRVGRERGVASALIFGTVQIAR
jgi:hypothetical protein